MSAGAAKDWRRLRRFLPPRCLRFFAEAVEVVGWVLSEGVGGCMETAAAYDWVPGFVADAPLLVFEAPPARREVLKAIAHAERGGMLIQKGNGDSDKPARQVGRRMGGVGQ